MASRWTFSFDSFENPERNDTWRHFSLYSHVVLGLLWRYSLISQRRFPRSIYSGISASRQSLGSKQLSQCKWVCPQYPFVFAPETAIFAQGKQLGCYAPRIYPASLLGSPTLEILLKSSEGCVLSSGMVKGEPCGQESVSSPPLIGEPYRQALVSSPPRFCPHVTSSSHPTTDGRLAEWSGTPPWLSVASCHPRS